MKAVIFGAGNIGRGFLGELFFLSGYRSVFVDVAPGVVDCLNRQGRYPHWVVSDRKTEKKDIDRVSAVSGRDREAVAAVLAEADLAATAVGVNNLARLAPLLAAGLAARRDRGAGPLDIVICENMLDAGDALRRATLDCLPGTEAAELDRRAGFVETVVSRMVPPVPAALARRHPLLVMVEPYNTLPVSRAGFRGPPPPVRGFLPVDDIRAWEEQKLYIHNLGHSVCAYYGYLRGHRFIWQAVRDEVVRERLFAALGESGAALTAKHPFLADGLPAHVRDLAGRFANRSLGDTVQRVGREPLRKLGPDDRLIGALRLCRERGLPADNICFAIACALRYDHGDDPEAVAMQERLARQGLARFLGEVAGLDPGDPAVGVVGRAWREL